MSLAIAESAKGIQVGDGGPFGCVVVRGDAVISTAHNEVLLTNDPTAHAEIVAIRRACDLLQHFHLSGCEVYCSCEPCPMCFGALYWARPERIFYANTRHDAAAIAFDDNFIYAQLALPGAEQKIPLIPIDMPEAKSVFAHWVKNGNANLF